jgi:hypothetical protein
MLPVLPGKTGFALKIFMAKKISMGNNLSFSTFAPKIFGPANFQPEFFLFF